MAIATQAVQHMCTTQDDDASIFSKEDGQKLAHQMAKDRRKGRVRFSRAGTRFNRKEGAKKKGGRKEGAKKRALHKKKEKRGRFQKKKKEGERGRE